LTIRDSTMSRWTEEVVSERHQTPSDRIISQYGKVRNEELQRAVHDSTIFTPDITPHFYWHLTQLCCPHSQTELKLEREPAAPSRYRCGYICKGCKRYDAEDADPAFPEVPYSMRAEDEGRMKRVGNQSKHEVPRRLRLTCGRWRGTRKACPKFIEKQWARWTG
jgi:hypothetical protein